MYGLKTLTVFPIFEYVLSFFVQLEDIFAVIYFQLEDDRFKAIFSDDRFEVDKSEEAYRLLAPVIFTSTKRPSLFWRTQTLNPLDLRCVFENYIVNLVLSNLGSIL